jgi:uncharacterized protein YqeY
MQNLKEKIQEEFVLAFKAKDDLKRGTLAMLKAKITEEEKKLKIQTLDDDQVLKVIISAAKQRRQSIEEFEKGGRTELSEKEKLELKVLEMYLPAQMTEDEIRSSLLEILGSIPADSNANKRRGLTMGGFNKKHPGLADPKVVASILDKILLG